MTVYMDKKESIKDQLNSYQKAEAYLNRLKSDTENELRHDHKGDKEKILDALDAGIRYLEAQKTNFKREQLQ